MIVAAIAVALACAGVAVLALRSGPRLATGTDSPVLARLEEKYRASTPGPSSASRTKADLRAVLREALQARLGSKLDKDMERSSKLLFADLKLRPTEWLIIRAGVSLFAGLLAVAAFNRLLVAPFGMGLGYLGCHLFLTYRTNKRRQNFDRALGPTIMAIANGLRAGYTFAQSIDLVSKTAPAPMDTELTRVTREMQLGVQVHDALSHMVTRNHSEDLKLLLTAVQIQAQVGGNLAQIHDSIEHTIRERARIKGDIKTLTGQARASGWILMILPFALAGLLELIAPTYFGPMFTDPVGLALLGAALFSMACGYAIIQTIVNVEV